VVRVECLLDTETSARVIWFDSKMLLKMVIEFQKDGNLRMCG
jgi:hypothetical protein